MIEILWASEDEPPHAHKGDDDRGRKLSDFWNRKEIGNITLKSDVSKRTA